MKKLLLLLISILFSLANVYGQKYYTMSRGSGQLGESEWTANSAMSFGTAGIQFSTANNPRGIISGTGCWYVFDRYLPGDQKVNRFKNTLEKAANDIFNSTFVTDGNMVAKSFIVADLATSNDNIKLRNNGTEAFLDANGDDNGLHIRSVTGRRLHLHDRVTIGFPEYQRYTVGGASLTVGGAVYIGPRDMTGIRDISSKTDNFLLWVEKGIVSENFALVKVADWSDHVFNQDYSLRPLSEVERFVQTHRHLPDVPSEKEVKEQGYNLHDMNKVFMQKIEELTLYVIQQQKEIDQLKAQLEAKN